MADFTISRSTGLMNAEPCGSVSATSIQTTSTQNNFLQGKPLEDLGRMAVSEGNIVCITQQQDEQATSQNEAAAFEGGHPNYRQEPTRTDKSRQEAFYILIH